MTINSINNTPSSLTVGNLSLDVNTLSSSSGDLILETDGVNKISFSNTSTTILSLDNSGNVLKPLQPCFLAVSESVVSNITGAGAVYTQVFPVIKYDIGSNFSSTTTFTAPVTGKYMLTCYIRPRGMSTLMLTGVSKIVTSNRTYSYYWNARGSSYTGAGGYSGIVCLADMDVSDTAYVTIQISDGTSDTADTFGSAIQIATWFAGQLIS